MLYQVTSKLELNLLNPVSNPQYAVNFAIKYRIPVIVTTSEYLAPILAHKIARAGQFKIICAVDYPKGDSFAMAKFKNLHSDFVAADGYEFLLSPNRSEVELRNEMKTIKEFINRQNPASELRWCLGAYTRSDEYLESMLKDMSKFPVSYVRTDQHLTMPSIKENQREKVVETVKSKVPFPIKVSGNIDYKSLESLINFKVNDNIAIKRFDINLQQAKEIVKVLEEKELNLKQEEIKL